VSYLLNDPAQFADEMVEALAQQAVAEGR